MAPGMGILGLSGLSRPHAQPVGAKIYLENRLHPLYIHYWYARGTLQAGSSCVCMSWCPLRLNNISRHRYFGAD